MATTCEIPTLDGAGTIPAYVARPDGMPRGAIIVQQAIFRVDPGIRKTADAWTAHGFAAEIGSRRDEAGTQLADRRTNDVFAAKIG